MLPGTEEKEMPGGDPLSALDEQTDGCMRSFPIPSRQLQPFLPARGAPRAGWRLRLGLEAFDLFVAQTEFTLVSRSNDRSGATTLTRMLRLFKSAAQVRANERNAAFVAA
jgi:hypothetical protein